MSKCKMEIIQRAETLTARDMKTISSYVSSVRYLRKMVPLVVYNIIYNRINFDDSFFVDRKVCEISFKMFKSGTKNHILADIFFCCKGVVEAIQKEYLREMHLLFYDQKNNAILEDYKFLFSYNKEPDPVSLPKSDEVIRITKQLFESIQMLAKYDKLSDSIDISMELLFDDEAPETYNPPSFVQPTELPLTLQLRQEEAYNTIGYLKTGYHKLKCSVNESAFKEESLGTSVILVEHDDNNNEVINGTQADDTRSNGAMEEITDEDQHLLNGINEEAVINDDVSSITAPGSEPEDSFRCPCGVDSPVELLGSVKCTSCAMCQHLFCIGYRDIDSIGPNYICIYCGAKEKNCSDNILSEMSPSSWQIVSCTRAVLNFSYTYRKPPLELLQKYDLKIKQKVLKLLADKIMKINTKTYSVIFNEDLAITMLTKLFFDFRLPKSIDLDETSMNF